MSLSDLFNKSTPEPQVSSFVYTEEQLMARLKFFIGVCLALTLTGIVFVVLYSIIFVTQPLNAISPIDQKFFELIVPIATFLTGTLSGIMLAGTKKEDQEAMLAAQKLANENFEATKKAMTAPPPRQEPTMPMFSPRASQPTSFGGGYGVEPVFDMYGGQQVVAQVVTGYGGKPAPAPAPQPER